MIIILTGAYGFVGTVMKQCLKKSGHVVYTVDRKLQNKSLQNSKYYQEISAEYDLINFAELPLQADAIIHAAASSPVPGISGAKILIDNAVFSNQLIDFAKRSGVKKFIYLSTISVYGEILTGEVLESTPIINPSLYGTTKRYAEQYLDQQKGVISSISIRLPGVIGYKSVRNWLTTVLNSARNGDEIKVYNSESLFNNAIHVDDLCQFVVSLLSSELNGAEIINVAAKDPISIQNVVELINAGFGSKSKITFSNINSTSFLISSEKAKDLFGYQPRKTSEILQRFIEQNNLAINVMGCKTYT